MNSHRLDQTTRTSNDHENLRAYWVDVILQGERGWTTLFAYSSFKAAAEMRDHWKGVKQISDYGLYLSKPVVDARVREVHVTVTLHP